MVALIEASAEKALVGNILRVGPWVAPILPGMFLRPMKCRGHSVIISSILGLFRQSHVLSRDGVCTQIM